MMLRGLIVNPSFWLGLGIGVLFGVLGSAGLNFDEQDSSRFLGAVLGSLIAVGSAVSLHFLKEESEIRSRRERLHKLLSQAQKFVGGLPKELDEKNFALVTGGLDVTAKYIDRCKRFCEAHEADDHLISSIGIFFDHLESRLFFELVNRDDDYSKETQEKIRELAIECKAYLDDCLAVYGKAK
jgi:hypothetical protein